ncbi:MAG: hypothetical protein QW506_05975 [Thermoproteota archaeon]
MTILTSFTSREKWQQIADVIISLRKLLIYRMHDSDVVIFLFASSKLMCTGVVNEKIVYDAVEQLMAELIQKGLLIR